MRSFYQFHKANKESVAQWMFKCGYQDLKEKGQEKVDDLIAYDWLVLKGYMSIEDSPYPLTNIK